MGVSSNFGLTGKLDKKQLEELQKKQIGTTLSERVANGDSSVFCGGKTGSSKVDTNTNIFAKFSTNGTSFIDKTRDMEEAKKAEMKEKENSYCNPNQDEFNNDFYGDAVGVTFSKTGATKDTGSSSVSDDKNIDDLKNNFAEALNGGNPAEISDAKDALLDAGLSERDVNALMMEYSPQSMTSGQSNLSGIQGQLAVFDEMLNDTAARDAFNAQRAANSGANAAAEAENGNEEESSAVGEFFTNAASTLGTTAIGEGTKTLFKPVGEWAEKNITDPIRGWMGLEKSTDKKVDCKHSNPASTPTSTTKSASGVNVPNEYKDDSGVKSAQAEYDAAQAEYTEAEAKSKDFETQISAKEAELKEAEKEQVNDPKNLQEYQKNEQAMRNYDQEIQKEAEIIKQQDEIIASEGKKEETETKNAENNKKAAEVNSQNISKLNSEIAQLSSQLAKAEDGEKNTIKGQIEAKKTELAKEQQELAKNQREEAEHRALAEQAKTAKAQAADAKQASEARQKNAQNEYAKCEKKRGELEKAMQNSEQTTKLNELRTEVANLRKSKAQEDAKMVTARQKMDTAEHKILAAVTAAKTESKNQKRK